MIQKTDETNEYLEKIPEPQKKTLAKLRDIITDNLPEGFEETILNNMISYVIPHNSYPPGNHDNPDEPLLFISLSIRSDHVSLYHKAMKLIPGLLSLFLNDLEKYPGDKPSLGQNTIKFNSGMEIPDDIIGNLCRKIMPDEWVEIYQENLR